MLYNRAFANTKIEHFHEATADCSIALRVNPTYVRALLLRAQCHEHLGKFEECIQDYSNALCTEELERYEKVEEVRLKLEKVTVELQHKHARKISKRAKNHHRKGNYRLAEQLYTEAIFQWPDNAALFISRCKTFMSLEEFKYALEDSKTAVELDGNVEKGYYEYMARCFLIFGDYDNAERNIEKINKNSRNNPNAKNLEKMCTELRECEKFINQSYHDCRLQRASKSHLYSRIMINFV